MPIDSVRVSAKAKDELIRLKKRTGIENWNTLCRWALCHSLAQNIGDALPFIDHASDSNIEMTWRTFSGGREELYWALVRERCRRDGLDATDEKVVANQFRLHLHRGIQYLASKKGLDISKLVQKVTEQKTNTQAQLSAN